MIVVCIDNKGLYGITLGKKYNSFYQTLEGFYHIVNDNGNISHIPKGKFEELSKIRSNKLKKIN
jgi:hypothetical protein